MIVYDFIRPEAAKAIVRGQLKKINARILKQNKITVNVTDGLLEHFYELAGRDEVLEMGGRGIGNLMEEQFINPLAEYIFEASCDAGDTVTADCEGGSVSFHKGE